MTYAGFCQRKSLPSLFGGAHKVSRVAIAVEKLPRAAAVGKVRRVDESVAQETQLSLGKADRTVYVRSPASDFQSRRESDLSEVTQFHARHVNGTLSRKLQ